MKWQDDIVKLNSPHSKLLYMIYYFSKSDELSQSQVTKLKEYVVLEDEKIFEILQEFENSSDELKFLNNLKQIYTEEAKFNQSEERSSKLKPESNAVNKSYKNQLSVNTDRSFLNNAMSNIKIRMNANGDSGKSEQEVEKLNKI
jgi:hypothetical protein